jgi:outer membrane protein assembly factor BamB
LLLVPAASGNITLAAAATGPVVTSVSPQFGVAAGGQSVTIDGANFVSGDTVKFGFATATNVSVVSATQITATSPAHGAGAVHVTVTDPTSVTSPKTAADQFFYVAADWSAYLNGPLNQSFNPGATSISTSNMANLSPIFQWNPPKSPNSGGQSDFASPIVYRGVIYVGLANGEMFAISLATQTVLWSQFLGLITPTTCAGTAGITGTATVAIDPVTKKPVVYVNAPSGHLVAMDAATGAILYQAVVGIPSTTKNDYYAWGSPTVANGKVYVPIASRCDNPLVVAGVRAYDQHAGTQLAFWDSQPAGVVGASIWSSPGVLPNGDVVVTTGNSQGTTQLTGAESVVVLDGTTLSVLDSWQIPKAQQIVDSDFGGSPTFFVADLAGVATNMIGACNKNGIFYAFRATAVHAGPVWQHVMGAAAGSGPAGGGQCDSAAIWDGHQLIVGGGSPVTIGGTSFDGSVQALDPSTGQPIWQTGLPGFVIGTPSEDGAGVVAAPVYFASNGQSGVYLLNASTGAILKFISTAPVGAFAQPVFDGNDLLVGDLDGLPLTVYAITTPGQSGPISVSPGTIRHGTTVTMTITGASGLTSPANVIVSGSAVRVASVTILSPTSASVKLIVTSKAPVGAKLDVTLVEPDLRAFSCTSCLTVS